MSNNVRVFSSMVVVPTCNREQYWCYRRLTPFMPKSSTLVPLIPGLKLDAWKYVRMDKKNHLVDNEGIPIVKKVIKRYADIVIK